MAIENHIFDVKEPHISINITKTLQIVHKVVEMFNMTKIYFLNSVRYRCELIKIKSNHQISEKLTRYVKYEILGNDWLTVNLKATDVSTRVKVNWRRF